MDLEWVWKAVLIVLAGSVILRLAGRKSISQMTVAQTVLMISIGTILIQPVSEQNIWVTFLIAALLVSTLLAIEYIQMKADFMERFFSGHAIVVIENGQVKKENLKKLRLPVDKLEMRLRQNNVQRIEDVQWATMETNGEIGYTLKPGLRYATEQDIQAIIDLIELKLPYPHVNKQVVQPDNPGNIFQEVNEGTHAKNVPEDMN
ncbi:DUF421 domain-containing protein [Salipaludibacillus aurantiacus]|uniref:Uncharacterized membrane protein YcaP, DUF421 family n=1 Tax=Salipaludibacillus aurantiacus TaxID=1601833 RepID=A0A1H9QBG0_9BACI|nr:DUF421 domain-containing protein [Salipaludibacillus aurantiacus]SER57767.1 Uncharacterized membrane protein YcaP, DUF421 family [Salipaludibacillus aurantiacus]